MDARREIISEVERRRRWPVEEKVRLLELAMQPGASLAAVADRHGVSRSLLFLWRKQAQAGLMPGVTPHVLPLVTPIVTPLKPDQGAMFAPVVVASNTARLTQPPIAPCKQAAHRISARTGCVVEISLSNGRVLKADEGISPERLGLLVAALDR